MSSSSINKRVMILVGGEREESTLAEDMETEGRKSRGNADDSDQQNKGADPGSAAHTLLS